LEETMAERWKSLLDRVPDVEPDLERLRTLALDGPRLPDPPNHSPASRIAVAGFALAIAAAALAFVFVALREDPFPQQENVPIAPREPVATVTLEQSEDGSSSATLSFAHELREGVPVEVLTPGDPHLNENRGGEVVSFLGWPSASLDIRALDGIEPEAIILPANTLIEQGADDAIIMAFSRDAEGEQGWNLMRPLLLPTDLMTLDSGTRYTIVVMGRGNEAAAPQFAFSVEVGEVEPVAPSDPADTLVESGGTYVWSDFDVRYADRGQGDSSRDPVAAVTFRSTWSTDFYPGEADCSVIVRDREGGMLATQETGFAHDEPMLPDGAFTVELPKGSARPGSAEGSCGPGMIFDGSSQYVFSNLRIEGGDLVGDVAWSDGTPVGYAACGIHVVGDDGGQAFQVLGLSTSPGRDRTFTAGGKFPAGSTPEVRCEPYRSPDQFTRAYWMPWIPGETASASPDSVTARGEPAATYVFSDVVAGPADAEPEDLAITFTVGWSGGEYPGVHECRFVAYGTDGSIVGEFTSYNEWDPGRWYRDVPGDPQEAVSGEVQCAAERLDTPGITDVEEVIQRTSIDEVMEERRRRLATWVDEFKVDEMTTETLAANLWAVWRSIPGAEMTKVWQLTDRMEYIRKLLCPWLPEDHVYSKDFC
jgi:hypothetical protein